MTNPVHGDLKYSREEQVLFYYDGHQWLRIPESFAHDERKIATAWKCKYCGALNEENTYQCFYCAAPRRER